MNALIIWESGSLNIMIILNKTKIFEHEGEYWVSIRDYEWEKAYKSGDTILIRVEDEWMRLEPWRVAMDREQFTKEVFKTKVGSKKHTEYQLYDLPWQPSEKAKELGVKELEEQEAQEFSRQVLN